MIVVYTGKPVKSTTKDGLFEIIQILEATEEVICQAINSIDTNLEVFRISTLEDL